MQDFGNVFEADFRGEWAGHQVSHRFKYRQYKCTCGAQRQDHGQFVALSFMLLHAYLQGLALWGRP
jgi:hypothetical protein